MHNAGPHMRILLLTALCIFQNNLLQNTENSREIVIQKYTIQIIFRVLLYEQLSAYPRYNIDQPLLTIKSSTKKKRKDKY
jgi:hypothetical protein